jgi:hypothetical protein
LNSIPLHYVAVHTILIFVGKIIFFVRQFEFASLVGMFDGDQIKMKVQQKQGSA